MEKVKFATMFNSNKTMPSPTGNDIYEWEFTYEGENDDIDCEYQVISENEKLYKGRKNLYESIQSFGKRTEYKTKINNQGVYNDGNIENGLYMDVSQLGNDFVGVDKYLTGLVNSIRQSVQNEQTQSQSGKNINQGSEIKSQVPEVKEQTTGNENTTGGGK